MAATAASGLYALSLRYVRGLVKRALFKIAARLTAPISPPACRSGVEGGCGGEPNSIWRSGTIPSAFDPPPIVFQRTFKPKQALKPNGAASGASHVQSTSAATSHGQAGEMNQPHLPSHGPFYISWRLPRGSLRSKKVNSCS